jgi:hypothetical protein
LSLVPPTVDRPVSDDPADGPFCYLSVLAPHELSPYGDPPVKVSDATDPLLRYMRPYFKNPYPVLGHIHWSDDIAELAAQTKPYYQRLARWIRRHWTKYGDFYLGPEAIRLRERGAQLVNVLPNQARFQLIQI